MLLTAVLLAITSFIYTQNFTFGPKIGGSIFTDQGKMGLNIGGFVGYDFGKIEIETEGVFFATLDEFNIYKSLVLIPLNTRIELMYSRSLSTFGDNLSQAAYSTVNFGISWNLFRKKTK